MSDEPTDLHIARLRRDNNNLNVTPPDLLRMCAEDIVKEGLTGQSMLVVLYDKESNTASSWRCGLNVMEEIGLINYAGIRSIFAQGGGS